MITPGRRGEQIKYEEIDKIEDINLLADYDPISGALSDGDGNEVIALGALPIQTPVSPNGKYMVTANTLAVLRRQGTILFTATFVMANFGLRISVI